MKCIHCGSDTKYKDRKDNGGRCGSCSHPFAFEPKTDSKTVSDGLFERVIKDVSGDGTIFFTERELWYEFNRRLVQKMVHIPRPFGFGAAACFGGGAIGAIILHAGFLFPVGIVGAIGMAVVGATVGKKMQRQLYTVVPFDDFKIKYLARYAAVHGSLTHLTSAPTKTGRFPATNDQTPPDLTSYSFDRCLVTESADIAAMLVANRFHFENNCAILSMDRRYPEAGRFDTILEMLRRNPRLTVFAVHDASTVGLLMAGRLRRDEWFPDTAVRIIDLGLRPNHLLKTKVLLDRGPHVQIPRELTTQLTGDEITWLTTGNVGEVAALRPARLMRALYQGFARSTQVGPDGELIILDSGPGVWVYDSGVDVYAADSFG